MGGNEKEKEVSQKAVENASVTALEAELADIPATGLSGLRDAMQRADNGPKQPSPVAIPATDYRPKHAIQVKEIVMAKLEGLKNEEYASQSSLEGKRQKYNQNLEMIKELLRENSILSRDIHDLEMIVELNRLVGSTLSAGAVSEDSGK